jgi:UDP-N-acetylmuramoylalanine--D-glutamate ligase
MILQMSDFIKNLKTPIAIIGMGRSGEAAKRLLLAAGIPAHCILTYDGKASGVDFQNPEKLMAEIAPKTLVVSPGVPLGSRWIKDAQAGGVFITSELSLACSTFEQERVLGVTGALGKSTTVSILEAGLKAFCSSYFVGGNLGIPLSSYASDVLENKRRRADWVVLEISSYQLENCENLNLEFSAITYLTSNHLERYDSLTHYYETKWSILGKTRRALFLNKNGGDIEDFFVKKAETSNVFFVTPKDSDLVPFSLKDARLIGEHNQDNLALAARMALSAGWPKDFVAGMKTFSGLEHRLENLGEVCGVRFINDSKATALDSVITAASAAAKGMAQNQRLHLLLGGRDKNLPWEELTTLARNNLLQFVFFGECREVAQKKSKLPGEQFLSLGDALRHILSRVKPGDTVLLSPGGTSLDEFKSFEDRGSFFKFEIQKYKDQLLKSQNR